MKNLVLLHVIRMTKLFTYAFVVQCLSMSFLFAWNGNAQIKDIEEVMIQVSLNNTDIEKAFSTIEKSSGYSFVYTHKEVRGLPKVSVSNDRQSVYELLAAIAQQTGLQFRQVNQNIHVRRTVATAHQEEPALVIDETADVTVTGTVTDPNGEPIPGVTVSVSGTTIGTATDLDGSYALSVPEGSTLVFSFIGFETQSIAIGDRSVVDVVLSEDMASLDEVVVVGYGTQNRHDLTGSITKIDNKVLSSVPVSSFDAALQGRAAGVQVIQSTGMAGAGTQIRVRGVGSITAGGEPLYVIDGIPIPANSGETLGAVNVNPLSSVNPNDIESIEILKDASAAAIYGSRGSNGVILITTKRGNKGKPKFSYNSRLAFSNLTRRQNMLNSEEFITLYNEAVANDHLFNPTGAPATRPLPGNIAESDALKTNTDWQDEVTQTGVSQFNDLSVSMGTDKVVAYLGLSHVNEKSFLVNDAFKRSSARLNLDYTPSRFLKVGGNFSYTYTDQNNIPVGYEGGYGRAISNALPYFPVFNDDGSFYQFPASRNPVAEINHRTRKSRGERTFASLFSDLNIMENLSFRLEGNLDYSDNSVYALYTQVLQTNPTASQTRRFLTNWNTKALLNYALEINNIHRFKFMVGGEMLKYVTNSKSQNVTFPAGQEDWLFNNPKLPPESNPDGTPNTNNRRTANPPSEYSFLSYFGRFNYALKDRYMLTATIRRDGSSRFGINNKFGTFPAVSAAWIVSDEDFLKSNSIISHIKLKGGYGITGNAEIGNYAQWGLTSVLNDQIYNGEQFWIISSLANPDLKWETTEKYDIALEYGFLQNRISGEIAYYINNASDLFLNVRTTTSTGYGSILANVGKLRNQGIEFSIKSQNIITKNFSWTTDFNISRNTNKVLDVGLAGPDALGGSGDTRVIVGKPIGSNYLVKTLYIDPEDGMPVYERLNADTKEPDGITKEYNAQRDRQVVGHPYPDFIGGIDNIFTWKSFDFGFTGTFQIGGNIYDDAEKFQMNSIGAWNLKRKALERWQKPGDVTSVPRPTLGFSGLERSRNTTEFLHSASYFRMKIVRLGYNIPGTLTSRTFVSEARISFSVTNLFTISEYDGDPEILRDLNSSQARNLSANVTYLTPPQARNYVLGINLNF